MFSVSREEITGGSLPRVLLVLAGPLVAQNFALVAQSVVDLFWVGRLGPSAVAAVGLSSVLVALVVVPVLAVFVGTQVVTAQRAGADDTAGARRVPINAVPIAVAAAAVLGAGLVLFADDAVALYGLAGETEVYAASYLTGYALALVATAASDTLESGFTGWGDTRAALYINLTAIAGNLVLDPLLILGIGPFPRWEVFGAAIATALGYALGAVFALVLLYRGRGGFRLTRDTLAIDGPAVRAVVTVGSPVAAQNASRQLARLVMVSVVSVVGGTAGLAAYYLGAQVATVAFVPPQGLGQAATSVVGQNLGADRPARARRVTWLGVGIAVACLSVLGAVQWLVPSAIARVFVPGISGQSLAYSVLYLQVLAYGYWALGAIYTLEAGFNGAGRTAVSMVSTLVQYWAVRIPIALVGVYALGFGVEAVFWAVTVSNGAAAVWLAGYFYYSTSRGMLRQAASDATGATG